MAHHRDGPVNEGRSIFRQLIGVIALAGGLAGLLGLYVAPIPDGNREPLLLALGLVLGWGSTVVSYEYGSSPAGRKAADVGVRLAEQAPTLEADTVNQKG